jgi:glycosyltransferase involved in cell wall biosynthesis
MIEKKGFMKGSAPKPCHDPDAPRIMMVTHVLPYPPAAGNEIRIFRMLQWFKTKGYRISLILKPLGNEEVSNECIAGVCQVVDDLHIYDSRASVQRRDNHAFRRDVPENRPHLAEMQDGFCPPWFAAEVESLALKFRPDAIVSEYIFMSRILLSESAARSLKIIDTHDLFSMKMEIVEKYGIANYPLAMSADDEAALLRRADVILAIQQAELEKMKCLVPDRTVLLTGIDMDIHCPDPSERAPGVVLIVASSNEFNVRGTQDFLDYTWPLVRERCPDARLRLVGKICDHVHTPDPSVRKIGFVADLSSEYSGAGVTVNPCGVGTGLKIKTVEALAWGAAHVGWPASADGMRELGDLPYIVANDAVEFADAIAELLQDAARARALGEAAHVFAERHFGASATYGPLAAAIEAHVASRSRGRIES